jgi:hypothetical protein
MLTALRLGNFKAFAETQWIPIRPLTLIFGANSSGKSSLLHGLLLAKEALEGRELTLDIYRTDAGGDSVDLGGFRQYVHRREAGRRIEWAAEISVASLKGGLAERLASVSKAMVTVTIGLELDNEGNPVAGAQAGVNSYELEADGVSLLRMSLRRDGTLRLDRLGHDHPVFREVLKAIVETATTTEAVKQSDLEDLSEVIAELVPEITASAERLLPRGVLRAGEQVSDIGQLALFPVSRGRRKEDLADAVRFFLPRMLDELIKGLSDTVASELARLRYLGPLRSYPPRHLAFSQYHDPNWFAGGGYAWDVVRRNEKVRNAVNGWLGSPHRLQTPYELEVRRLIAPESAYEQLWDGLDEIFVALTNKTEPLSAEEAEEWRTADGEQERGEKLSDLDAWDPDSFVKTLTRKLLDAKVLEGINELVLLDRRTNTVVSHRDVGIGISQVLPVLVAAYASTGKILAMEQPEIHLHPALQAELGDVFIQSALGKQQNTFILETHSEHLILRIMRRMRDTVNGSLPPDMPPVRPEDVAILYVQPKDSTAVVRVLELDEEGQLLDPWPGGFFEEGFRERFA